MDKEKIKEWGEREPFRPFGIRLTNNGSYEFRSRWQFGAPGNYDVIFVFLMKGYVLIDPKEISEIYSLEQQTEEEK